MCTTFGMDSKARTGDREPSEESRGRQCCRYFASEFHYSKLCFCYKDKKAFAYSPWLPYKWKWQWLYVVYRWVVMLYFLAWLIVFFVQASQSPAVQAKYLIYLTNWGFLVLNAYFVVATISVTLTFTRLKRYPCTVPMLVDTREERTVACTNPLMQTLNGLHWLLGVVGGEYAIGITILFWLFFNNPSLFNYSLSVESLHVHMLNGIVAVIDTWVTGLPFRILHFVYVVLFGSTYVAFTGVYFASNGTDIMGESSIYPILDYERNPGLAAGVGIACALMFSTALHLAFLLMYMCRYWLTRHLQTRIYQQPTRDEPPETLSLCEDNSLA